MQRDNGLTIRANTKTPCLLVITDPLSAGWSAQPLPGSTQTHYELQHADFVAGAITLSPGRHLIQTRYNPPGARTGAAIFSVGLALWCAALIFGLRWRESR